MTDIRTFLQQRRLADVIQSRNATTAERANVAIPTPPQENSMATNSVAVAQPVSQIPTPVDPNPPATAPKQSVLAHIVTDVEKFFKHTGSDLEKFASAFSKLFRKLPSALQTVENFTQELAPVITAALALIDPSDEPEVAGALGMVETGLAAVQASASAANSGQSLLANLENFATTVPALLSGLQIKNSTAQGAITRVVTLVVGESKVLIPAVQSWIAQIKASQPAQQ